MSSEENREYRPFKQELFFEDAETGETLAKFAKSSGVEIPPAGATVTLAIAEFEGPETIADELRDARAEYVVEDVEYRFAQPIDTVPDPSTVHQYAIVTVLVTPADDG
ncbi:hypothetical protein [Natrarchaeobius oligotrophus]|uniref:Uncharacterized protein n=1 Tax=Natrarchaeobius chitinivorans TaxID=1679083 RepID=A0A3N6MDG0_NATCH|nr:hypothetical protein [Natrarchaeobius chitinivorans]RQH01899.1 hypothetical protein EA472_06225 [Natrarchaeobius chitinivorans]